MYCPVLIKCLYVVCKTTIDDNGYQIIDTGISMGYYVKDFLGYISVWKSIEKGYSCNSIIKQRVTHNLPEELSLQYIEIHYQTGSLETLTYNTRKYQLPIVIVVAKCIKV